MSSLLTAPARAPRWRRPIKQRSRVERRSGPPHTRVSFSHPSELEFARFLDFYRIRWAYEPVAFPLGWEDGRVTEMFTPDFYLPEHDLYVELTTMKQSLVTPKHRKLRRLRELYPEVKIRLLHRRDYEQLLAQAGYAHADLDHLRASQVERILVSPLELEARVRSLARRISRDYAGRSLILVGMLKGVTFFLADLARQLTVPLAIDYLGVSRYARDHPSGARRVAVQRDLDHPIRGRDVLLVEDVVNTGLTLDYVLGVLRDRGPASLEVVTLLDRPSRRIAEVRPRYVGFQVPNDYVVGYGLDYRERYRNLPFICALHPSVYAQDAGGEEGTPEGRRLVALGDR
ncbi:MAG TPA: hypoxanthine phosphoribosyltransferase [Candidatus Dormibacteraeota bacterium]|nr:hypoxanthine phosphoribosyltransferase [Candidatus Dormibacteraeota bacterium]